MWGRIGPHHKALGGRQDAASCTGPPRLTALQVFVGVAAYTVRAAAIDDPQPMPLTIWTTVAHVVLGALVFAAANVLATERRA